MAVRLRNVTESAEEPAEITTGWDEALKPSSRILGGRLTDKLGSRMGLRPSEEHVLPEQRTSSLDGSSDRELRAVGLGELGQELSGVLAFQRTAP